MTIITLVINSIAGNNIKAVSDKHPLSFTPAGYTFSIWGVIYSLLLYITYKYNDLFSSELKRLYLYSNILNSSWIILWSSAGNVKEDTKYIITSSIALLLLAFVLIQILLKLDSLPQLVLISFGIYIAWVCFAAAINLSIILKEQLNVPEILCRNTLYLLVTILPFIIQKYIDSSVLSSICATFSWALIGILNNNKNTGDMVVYIPLVANIINLILQF